MTTEDQTPALVLKSAAGDYFLITQETLERGRVSAEHKPEVERLIAAAEGVPTGEGDDTQGHSWLLVPIIIGFGIETALIIGYSGPDFKPAPAPSPYPPGARTDAAR